MKSRVLTLLVLSFAFAACSRNPEGTGPERHYQLTGQVVALDREHQVATIDAAAIPNFMGAMTMEYPVKSKEDFDRLHVGDKIKATVNVSASGTDYNLSAIQKQSETK